MPNTANSDASRSGPPFRAGLAMALSLAAVLLLVTAFQSLATFFIRMYASDVMLGVVNNFTLFSRATWDVAVFVGGLILVHAMFAATAHMLAYLTAVAWPAADSSRNGLVVLWFALLLAAVLLQNAAWFPRSHAGAYYHEFAVRDLGPATVAEAVVLLAAALAALTVLAAAAKVALAAPAKGRRYGFLAAMAIVPLVAVIAVYSARSDARLAAEAGKPNIVLIGIDSLRLKHLRRFGGNGATPHIDAELEPAVVFKDTITPLARTFPSWVSILTGRDPRSTGALFNLVHRPAVDSAPTIGELLRAEGYSTYYVTDEVRFSNVDESYGFDQLITPPIGAADFLIGRTADLPLSNVVANSPLGEFFLDYLHGNRAVAGLYRPSTFISRFDAQFNPAQPVFLALHLTAAHWPYYHADTPVRRKHDAPATPEDVYAEALGTADQMFGEVMHVLRRKGVLDNAFVVILSDHGEALALPEDSLIGALEEGRVSGLQEAPKVLNWGHGQSVLSPVQFQVLLGFRGYGSAAALTPAATDSEYPASLQDVLPTILDVLGVQSPAVDGTSLAPWLRHAGDADASRVAARIRFTETDIRVAPSADGTIDEDQAAAQAASLFAVDTATGWLHLRSSMMPTLMQFKERAAIGEGLLLAALPVAPGRHEYLLVDRSTGAGRVLAGRPGNDDAPGQRLWDAMHSHFEGELHPAVVVGAGEQIRFDAEWSMALNQSPASSPGT